MSSSELPDTAGEALQEAPASVERLQQLIGAEYESLPRQLKRIASYMSQQSDRVMVDRVSDIARQCEVHPSAIVRFSQRFGFKGFSEMQALFREAYTRCERACPAHFFLHRAHPAGANLGAARVVRQRALVPAAAPLQQVLAQALTISPRFNQGAPQ